MASFAEAGSPYNKVAGLGFSGVPSPETVEEIERAYTAWRHPKLSQTIHPPMRASRSR